ncbi:unnamed protein product [Gordionus sp. m RMFG-2023]
MKQIKELKKNFINKRRLESINIKHLQTQKKRALIKSSLDIQIKDYANVNTNNKPAGHIVFSDPEEPDFNYEYKKLDIKNKNLQLFQNDETDTNNKSNIYNGFNIKPQFEGKKGEKLLKLSLSIGNDKRFVLGEKFASSDSEEEELGDTSHDDKDDLKSELETYNKTLNSLLSEEPSSHHTNNVKTKINKFSNSSISRSGFQLIQRYDPNNPDHCTKYDIKINPISNNKGNAIEDSKLKNKSKHILDNNVTKVEKDAKCSFEVLKDFKTAFTQDNEDHSKSLKGKDVKAMVFKFFQDENDNLDKLLINNKKINFESISTEKISDIDTECGRFNLDYLEDIVDNEFREILKEEGKNDPTFLTQFLSFDYSRGNQNFSAEPELSTIAKEHIQSDQSSSTGQNFFIDPSIFEDPNSTLMLAVSNFCQKDKSFKDPQVWESRRKELSRLFRTKRKRFLRHTKPQFYSRRRKN